MPSFSKSSFDKIKTTHPILQALLLKAIEEFDFKVLEGHRGEEAQNQAYESGASKARFGESPHNSSPSIAVDLSPWPIDWNDRERFTYLAGLLQGLSKTVLPSGVSLRWGGDWDQDTQLIDNKFDDLVHFELVFK